MSDPGDDTAGSSVPSGEDPSPQERGQIIADAEAHLDRQDDIGRVLTSPLTTDEAAWLDADTGDGGSRLERIRTNPQVIVGDPENLVSHDWSGEWDADQAPNQ